MEGIVTVYDCEGYYVGCMGRETWDRLLHESASEIFVGSSTQPVRP